MSRINFGAKPNMYPLPVLIIATYDKDGNPDAMNAAWGVVTDFNEISISMGDHKTGPSISRTSSGKSKLSKAATISTEINLLGKTVDEAVAELDKYLDDAYLSHLPSVRVVHGKGTGALRKGIHNYLRRQKHVADFHLAEFGEGDAGVTIVTFKK